MTDDLLDLRLRVARALGWKLVSRQKWLHDVSERWRRDGEDGSIYVSRDFDDNILYIQSGKQDWTTDLGACQEVLDAAQRYRWRGMFDMAEEEPHKYVHTATFFDPIGAHNVWASATAPTFPEAICRAFVQAVEASSIPSTG